MHLDRDVCYRALLTRDARFDGRFFIAVRTTGIYCRPICPARPPKLEHVVFMPTSAAAHEAGFRPCLRCRPEVSPDLAVRAAPSVVSRAMALIAAGALNEDHVDALASRLGLGERQLRRLFRVHVGASPKAVAQARRVLLAKQLITDTRLSLTQVAFAAGFGSVRRFNDTFQKLYGRPPQRLRRTGADAPHSASAITLTLPCKPPFDWAAIVRFLSAHAIPGVEHVDADRYARTISIGGASGTIVVAPRGAGRDLTSLVATIDFPAITELPAILDRVRHLFDLGADPAAIGAQLCDDPLLAPFVGAHPGVRVPGAWDGFELAVCAILEQHRGAGAGSALAGRLVAIHGAPIRPPHGSAARTLRYVFPTPHRLASADLETTLGISRETARAIVSLAAAAASDPRLFEPSQGLDDAIARLTARLGIGEDVAHYVAMRALREPDAFPLAMLAPARIGRIGLDDLRSRAAAWRPWRAYAALHLWTEDPATRWREERREIVA